MPVDKTEFDAPQSQSNSPLTISLLNLPLPFIILLAAIGYLLLVLIALVLRHLLQRRGVCGPSDCAPCGQEGDPCCACCITLNDACNCCERHTCDACLNSICPQRKTHNCAELLLCQICSSKSGQDPVCGWKDCECAESEYCEDTTCCCFRCHCRALPGVGMQAPLVA